MYGNNIFDFSQVSGFYYTPEQLSKIRSVRVGIAGVGGLGSNCALALVRCGFEKFVIADFDIVSVSNLNRQQYFPEEIGKPKVECFVAYLQKINPSIDCRIKQLRISSENVHDLFNECQCVVEAFDNAESKAMLVGEIMGSDKLLVSASGIGGHGSSDRIVTRKVRDNFYLIGDGVSEVGPSIKPYAPCVMIAAAKQADVVLNWVLNL
jgi:sulfur carrier protein ThiS adenylyltransferase